MTLFTMALIVGAFLLAGAIWLLYTTPGAQFLVGLAADYEPRLELRVQGGSVLEGIDVADLRWQDEAEGVEVTLRRGSFRWSVRCMLQRELCIKRLHADGLEVQVEPDDSPIQEPTIPLEARGLPEIDVPLPIRVRDVRLRNLYFESGTTQERIDRLDAAFRAEGTRWDVDELQIERSEGWVEVDGHLYTEGAWALGLNARANVAPPGLPSRFRVVARVGGDVTRMRLNGHLDGGAQGDFELDLRPLADGLPFRLVVTNAAGGWPLDTRETVELDDLRATVVGDLNGVDFDVHSRVTGHGVPEGRWRVAGATDAEAVQLDTVEAELLNGTLEGEAQARWGGLESTETLEWSARVSADALDLSEFQDHAPSDVHGSATAEGGVGETGWDLTVRTEGISGRVQEQAVRIAGGVDRERAGDWVIHGVDVTVPQGEGQIAGRIGDRWDLTADLRVEDLAAVHPEMAGRIEARVRAQGTPEALDVRTDGELAGARWQDVKLESGTWRGAILDGGRGSSQARVDLSGLEAAGRSVDELRLVVRGTESVHVIEADLASDWLDARIATVGGIQEREWWEGMVTEAWFRHEDRRYGPAEVAMERPFPLSLAADEIGIGAHCWSHREAALCLEEAVEIRADQGRAAVTLTGVQAEWFEPFLPDAASVTGTVEGEARAEWQNGDWDLDASLSSDGGALAWEVREEDDDGLEEPVRRTLTYEELALAARYTDERLYADLLLDTEEAGSARLSVNTDPAPGARDLAGEVQIEGIRLGFFQPFLPQLRDLQGEMHADGQLGGHWSDPQFHGVVALEGGRVEGLDWPMTPEGIEATVEVEGDSAELTGHFDAGDGRAELRGAAGWQEGDWHVELGLDGEGLAVRQAPMVQVEVDPSLRARVEPGRVTVGGEVHVPRGSVTVRELPQRAVAHSGDVVVVRRGDLSDVAVEGAAGWALDLDIEVSFGRNITLAGYGVRGRLGGAIRVRQTEVGGTEAFGEIRIDDGLYQAYGQRLTIRRGVLLFSGPADRPNIDVEAVREVPRDRVVAGIRVEGPADDPMITLFGEPPMSQEDALSYLLRGRPMGADGPGGDELLAQAALALGVYGGGGAAGALAERLGVQDFEIEATGEGDTTQVVVSGFLTPRVYVAYGVGVFEPINTLTLRYHLTWQMYLEAVSGVENALDLMYRFEID